MTSPTDTPVLDILRAYRAGQLTLDQVAADFATRDWPVSKPRRTLAAIEADPDPEPPPPGSFAEVGTAYTLRIIDIAEYEVLLVAATVPRP